MSGKPRRKALRHTGDKQCGEVGLQKIMYGMPSEDFDFEKYIVGGCMPSEADLGCRSCEWTGTREELES